MRCKHCYIFDSESYSRELENELDLEQCKKIVDDFVELITNLRLRGSIQLTGGDPLLADHFWDLLKYIRKKKIDVGIMGNPHLLTQNTIEKLKKIGIRFYQFSIDGDRETHDYFRNAPGSFDQTLAACERCSLSGICTFIHSTISKTTSKCIEDIIMAAYSAKAHVFDWARLVPIGHGTGLLEDILSPLELRNLFERIINIEQKIGKIPTKYHMRLGDTEFIQPPSNHKMVIGRKDPLWALYYYEKGILKPKTKDYIVRGCIFGANGLVILADGTVLGCRRLPIPIGKVPEEKLWDIFIESDVLNQVRDFKSIEECGECELRSYCRGCRAVTYAVTGDLMGKDPQCWKDLM